MARLTVYCDDSGTHPESRVAVVAGFISTVSQWEIFQKEWRKVLRKNGIQILRRADLESYHGEFLKWDEARRRAFLEPLHRIIRRRIKVPIGQSVQRRDFEEIVPHDIKGKCGGIYGFLAHSCLVAVRTWCEKPSRQHTAPINWVFEAGTHGRKEFEEMLSFFYAHVPSRKELRLGSWSFAGKELTPLQAADLLAYEYYRFIDGQVVDEVPLKPIRASFRYLVGADPYSYVKHWSRDSLLSWAQEWERTQGRVSNMETINSSH